MMKKITSSVLLLGAITTTMHAQENKVMTPEMLLGLNRVSPIGVTKDGKNLLYKVSKADLKSNEYDKQYYQMPIGGGTAQKIDQIGDLIADDAISPNGKYKIEIQKTKLEKVTGQDHYDDVAKSDVKIYNSLNYRHWDSWNHGEYDHVTIKNLKKKKKAAIDIMAGEPYDCPTKPFGGGEDYIWSPDSKQVLYVTKKVAGTAYAKSTNTDIYAYDLKSKRTTNLTEGNEGYDTQPAFSEQGVLAWCQMKRDGYESDKNDIIVKIGEKHVNLTADWDGTVYGFLWSKDGKKIYFNAPVGGTVHVFELTVPANYDSKLVAPKQLTQGQFDVTGIIAEHDDKLIVTRTDMNHAREIYMMNLSDGKLTQLTFANKELYESINLSKVEKRMVETTDGKQMLTWVIYPPNFDKSKKYPTLLYCQGGPQGALSQFYSYRWNFQVMAAQGYIVVAPNRRGMPGYGVEWNEQISGDYGGQNMQDYLAAIDDVAKESYVDKDRLGCVGASYGGYSCFFLAGHHKGRFKTFIAHDGIFNWRSMYGTTEELFFVNWDLGGAYWGKNATSTKSYNQFNPINHVDKWDTPILVIQGGKDYRVPIGQGLEAFQAAQLKGIKSRLLYFPEENHWVLSPQNAVVWQREFFKWLKETL
jgi:dipeptidyl aminopeptidase/acylaminoacyl peptidase